MSDITLNTQSITGNHNFVPPGTDWNLGSGSKKWNGGYFGTIIADNGIPAGTAATGGDKIGQIRFSINPNIEPGYLALNGQEVNREDYPNLWEWVQQQVGFLVEEGEWQSISSAHNGNVGKYSVGDGTSTFRLPNLGCWGRGGGEAGTANGVGGNLDAGLPNITGTLEKKSGAYPLLFGHYRELNQDGALWTTSEYDNRSITSGSTLPDKLLGGFNFDASRSNSIYDNSTTVQPESIIGIWLVKAYHVPVTQMNEDFTINDIEISGDNNFDLGLRFFNSLEEIGVTTGQETLVSIFNALPANSRIMYYVSHNETGYDSGHADIYPTGFGTFIATRVKGANVVVFEFHALGGPPGTNNNYMSVYYTASMGNASGVVPVWGPVGMTGIGNGMQRNGIYRGINVGTISSTSELETWLTDHNVGLGAYTDLYLGDYITIQDGTYNANWMIAGFDTEFYKGWLVDGSSDVQWINQPHITLIPRVPLFNAQMNSTNTTSGGYKGSAMHTSTLPTVVSNLQTVLGTHLLKRYALLSSAVDTTRSNMYGTAGGASSSWEWTEVYATLPSEMQIYGSTIWSSSGYDTGEACMKLPVFNFINHVQFSRWSFWLRGVASSGDFCRAGDIGDATAWGASSSGGVRPVICIG
jgi:hypothetical protein